MGSNPTAGILFFIVMFLLWCRLLCQAQRLYSSVVKRQSCKLKVLGSIPSGGYYFVAGFVVCRLLVIQFFVWRGLLRSSALSNTGVWRNGSASDSRSEGWEFESLCPHFVGVSWLARMSGLQAVRPVRRGVAALPAISKDCSRNWARNLSHPKRESYH